MQLVPITLKEQYQIDLLTRLTSRHLSHAEKDSLTRPDGKSFLQRLGSVAEWSKALVLGTSHFGGVGSNPTTIKLLNQLSGVRIRQSRIKNQFYYFLDFHLYWNERSTLVINDDGPVDSTSVLEHKERGSDLWWVSEFTKYILKIRKVRQPGIEPGSIAWKATMLTFTPPTLYTSVNVTRLLTV